MDRLFQMLVNTVLRKLVKTVVNRGADHFAGKGKPASEMTEAERQQAQAAKAMAKRARDLSKLARRLR
ncbi:MAG: hypothetical protein ABIQ85_05045 [Cypionkella sp.]